MKDALFEIRMIIFKNAVKTMLFSEIIIMIAFYVEKKRCSTG